MGIFSNFLGAPRAAAMLQKEIKGSHHIGQGSVFAGVDGADEK